MINRINFILVLLLAIFILSIVNSVYSQQINSDVKLILERLPLDKQRELQDLDQKIETYINDFDWTGEEFEEPLKINIQIFLRYKNVGYEDRYTGTFLISNNLDIQYYDKYWIFPYKAGDQIIHNEAVFHAFTGFIDFYIYILLSEEYDKYGRFLGTPYLKKSKEICNLAQFHSQYILGWRERMDLIEQLLSVFFKPFRKMKDQFFLGLSYVGEDSLVAQKYCRTAFSFIDSSLTVNPDNDRVKYFLHAYNMKFIDVLGNDKNILKQMISIDPMNEALYKKLLNK